MRWEFLKFEECFFIVNGLLYMLLNGCFVFIWYILLFLVIGVFRKIREKYYLVISIKDIKKKKMRKNMNN